MKKEEEIDSEDDFDMVTSAPPAVTVKAEKPKKEEEEDEDSEEDEDEWEEVEGKWGVKNSVYSRKRLNNLIIWK